MNLFRLKDKIDRGPAISSVGQRRSLGLLNLGSQEQRPENVRLGNTERPLAIHFVVKTIA